MFYNSEEWSESSIKKTGLPRPYLVVPKKYYFKNNKRYLAKKIPIPYQSTPGENTPIDLNIENEEYVVSNDLCSYCGLSIDKDSDSIRWMIEKEKDVDNDSKDFVPSDFRPFHIECMRQARIYCPFMRTLKDSDFEIEKQRINLQNAKKYTKELFKIKWKEKERSYVKKQNNKNTPNF
jgi:hypothetical protein